MTRTLSSAFAMLLLAGSACPASAMARHVSYADLDLGTPAGRTTMEARIRRAATQVCLMENPYRAGAGACRAESVARAQADLDRAVPANRVQLAAR